MDISQNMVNLKKNTIVDNPAKTNNRTGEGFVMWFTGLPCSGKTTIADKLAEKLRKSGGNVERLDGDIVRQFLSSDLGFSKEDRNENIKRVVFVARLLARNGVAVLVSLVSPYRKGRESARRKTANFIEVYVDCSSEECEKRDVKEMYKLAREGKIKNFTGVDDPYEKPLNPEITLHTDTEASEESVAKIAEYLIREGFIE